MTHIDDHTLELYVLGAKSVDDKSVEIEAHLQVCGHCRAYAEKIETFYARLDENLEKETLPNPKSALIRRHTDELAKIFHDDSPPVPYRPTTRIERFRYFIRRHPVVTGSGAFAALAGLALLASNVVTTLKRDTNPSYHRYNVKEGLVEIRNAGGELLWNIPADKLESLERQEYDTRLFSTIVTDIDGDGKNEVLTTTFREADRKNNTSPLRVFDGSRNLRFPVQFTKPVQYLSRDYPESWQAIALLAIDGNEPGKKEILVKWGCSRSPNVITRIDPHGNILGEYWHFGDIACMVMTDLEGDGRQELVIAGIDDAKDTVVAGSIPFIAVLDPHKITGGGKSSASEGFHLPVSNAEIYYIGLRRSLLTSVMHENEFVVKVERDLPDALTFLAGQSFSIGTAAWEYIFNHDMSLRTVKSTSVSGQLSQRLREMGKLPKASEQQILDELKEGVRYWDGKEWRKDVARVRHSEELTVTK